MSTRATVRAGSIALLAAVFAGCVMPDQISQLQKDISDVRQELRRVTASQEAVDERLAAIERDSADPSDRVTRAEVADLRAAVDAAARDASINAERLTDLEQRVDRIGSHPPARTAPVPLLPAPDPVASTGAPPAPGASADPESLYNTAYADFSRGNFALAVSGFEEYVATFPTSPNADNALYWIGECRFSQGDFRAAVAAFDGLLERYPDSDKSAAANLKKGLAYMEQNDVQRAILQLRFVVSEYPRSDEAKVARDKLASLGASI